MEGIIQKETPEHARRKIKSSLNNDKSGHEKRNYKRKRSIKRIFSTTNQYGKKFVSTSEKFQFWKTVLCIKKNNQKKKTQKKIVSDRNDEKLQHRQPNKLR